MCYLIDNTEDFISTVPQENNIIKRNLKMSKYYLMLLVGVIILILPKFLIGISLIIIGLFGILKNKF